MLIVPIGHESLVVERLPFATFGIMAACLTVFVFTWGRAAEEADRKQELLAKIEAAKATVDRDQEVGPEELEARQSEIDRYREEYTRLSSHGLLGRFGYVPASPRLTGLITHMFLHAGVMHLVFNLLFLWVAAVKLENIWGHSLFLGLYLMFGICAALSHQATHLGSDAPLIGASGAVAGLMGALAVRLAKSKIRFFYFYWFLRLKPSHGTFEAPAYLMLPLWFAGELFFALYFDVGPIAHWAHVGGFLTGALVALAFRLTDFEQKVLGREPDEEPEDPDGAPLVAFQPMGTLGPAASSPVPDHAPEKPSPADLARFPIEPVRFSIRELSDITFPPTGLSGRLGMRSSMHVGDDEITGIAAGRIDHLDGTEIAAMIDSGLDDCSRPAYLALLVRSTTAPANAISAYIIDGNRLKYEKLLNLGPGTALRKEKAFVAFVKSLLPRFPNARYVPGTGAVGEHNLPLYADLESFLSSVRKFLGRRDLGRR